MAQSTTLSPYAIPPLPETPPIHPPSPARITAPAPGPELRTASAAAVPTWGPAWPPGRCRLSLLLPSAGGGAWLVLANAGWCGGHCFAVALGQLPPVQLVCSCSHTTEAALTAWVSPGSMPTPIWLAWSNTNCRVSARPLPMRA
ncbi:hypothetical protein HaLaN_24831, partial [Haematococcus lacustris]